MGSRLCVNETAVHSDLESFVVELLSGVASLLRDGVRFAFREPAEGEEQQANVAFLEILSEFSFKLLQQDRVHL